MIDIIEYKNYLGTVEVDFDDDCIYVSVSNAPGLNLIAEGSTPGEAEQAFRRILDDYLESAKEMDWEIIEPIIEDNRQPDVNSRVLPKASPNDASRMTLPVASSRSMATKKRETALANR